VVPDRLYRSRTDRMIGGVCAGVGHYLGVDPTLIRLLLVVATIMTGGLLVLLYAAAALIMPEEPAHFAATSSSNFGAGAASDPTAAPGEPGFGTAGPAPADEPFGFRDFGGWRYPSDEARHRRHQWLGWGVLSLGLLILVSNLHLLSWLNLGVTWPVFLILAGLLLLLRQR
jgi:phage shock protein C